MDTDLEKMYAELEKAARNTLRHIISWVGDIEERHAVSEVTPYTHCVEVSAWPLQDALAALDTYRAAPHPAHVCETCEFGVFGWNVDGVDWYGCGNSKLRMGGAVAMPFGCTEWRLREVTP